MDALHGMGGIGKSVLARALCDDPEVQAAFPDGILWATLGQTPDLLARLREWIDVLGGIVSETAPTVERITAILADLLKERACLLDRRRRVEEGARRAVPRGRAALPAAAHHARRGARRRTGRGGASGAGHGAGRGRGAAGAVGRRGLARGRPDAQGRDRAPAGVSAAGDPAGRRAAAAQGSPERGWQSFDAAKLEARRVETVHDSLAATFDLSLDD